MSQHDTHGGDAVPEPATLAAETRAPGTVAANRAVLGLLGLLLTLAGAAGLATGLGLFGRRRSDLPVLSAEAEEVAATGWFWPAIAVAGGLLALLCLWWLLVQARSNRIGELRLVTDPQRGHTDLAASGLADALTTEIEDYRGVSRASAHVTGAPTAPRVSLTVTLDGRVEPAEVHRRVVEEAVVHARTALSRESLPVRLELQLPRAHQRDVR